MKPAERISGPRCLQDGRRRLASSRSAWPARPGPLPGPECAWRTGGSEGSRSPALTSSRVSSGCRHLEELSFKLPRSVGIVQLAGRPAPDRLAREWGLRLRGWKPRGVLTSPHADSGRSGERACAHVASRRVGRARGQWRGGVHVQGRGAAGGRSTRLVATCLRLAGLAPNPGARLSVLPTRFSSFTSALRVHCAKFKTYSGAI